MKMNDHRSLESVRQNQEQQETRVKCENCALFRICLPKNVSGTDLKKLDSIIERHQPVARGKQLFKSGDRFRSIYAVRSGAVKTYQIDANGNEQVCGFHLPGELIGLDGIVGQTNSTSARMLSSTGLCEIPYDKLEALGIELPELQREVVRLLSREIVNTQWQLILVGNKKAEERTASLLCNISERLQLRGYSGTEFNLPMSRSDIANFLGLTIETTSRVITRLQKQSLISAKGKSLVILDLPGLKKLAGYQPLH